MVRVGSDSVATDPNGVDVAERYRAARPATRATTAISWRPCAALGSIAVPAHRTLLVRRPGHDSRLSLAAEVQTHPPSGRGFLLGDHVLPVALAAASHVV